MVKLFMRKINYIFIGECIIIVCLLIVIGVLLKSEQEGKLAYKVEATSSFDEEEGSSDKIGDTALGEQEREISDKTEDESYIDQENIIVDGVETTPVTEIVVDSQDNQVSHISQTSSGEKSENTNSAKMPLSTKEVIEKNNKTQIVVFGDSIWNTDENGNGIAEYIMKEKDVIIYNCSIGGTTAAVYNESVQWDNWTSNSFNGMMYIANDIISEDELIPGEKACEVFKEIDFTQVDYIIVSYGLNDYFSDVPIHPQEYYDLTSFVGALRHGVRKLQKKYPQAEIVLTSPTYTEWFQGERQFGLGDYVEAARGVSAEYETYFLDMYHALGKNPGEKLQYLEDGVHLTSEGMALYARSVIDFLNNQGL